LSSGHYARDPDFLWIFDDFKYDAPLSNTATSCGRVAAYYRSRIVERVFADLLDLFFEAISCRPVELIEVFLGLRSKSRFVQIVVLVV
jgi:hypothetical protein